MHRPLKKGVKDIQMILSCHYTIIGGSQQLKFQKSKNCIFFNINKLLRKRDKSCQQFAQKNLWLAQFNKMCNIGDYIPPVILVKVESVLYLGCLQVWINSRIPNIGLSTHNYFLQNLLKLLKRCISKQKVQFV